MKTCKRCKLVKDDSGFYPRKSGRKQGQLLAICKECSLSDSKKFREQLRSSGKYKAFNREHGLKKHFGITAIEYDLMFARQGCKCAACGTTENRRAMPVDHDHKTGKIRGILCDSCNLVAGRLNDSPDALEAVATYLRRHELRETAERLGLLAVA